VRFAAQVLFRLADGAVTEEFHQSDLDHLRAQLRGDRPSG
jgi:23S rRNA A2030 N6-methylase RlmJ